MRNRTLGALLSAALLVGCGACGAVEATPTIVSRVATRSSAQTMSPPTGTATVSASMTATGTAAARSPMPSTAVAPSATVGVTCAAATAAKPRPSPTPAQAAPVVDASGCGCPQGCTAPPLSCNCRIKGNINDKGEKIYHTPGQQYYEKTIISPDKGERWFCTEDEAVGNGWRKSKV